MHRRAAHAHAVLERLPLRVETGKRRQQRWMNVQDAIGKRVEQRRPHQPHETGETDNATSRERQHIDDRLVVGVPARRNRAGPGTRRRMPASRARSSPAASRRLDTTTAIRASSPPPAIASMIDCRFDPRPEIRTPSRRFTSAWSRSGPSGRRRSTCPMTIGRFARVAEQAGHVPLVLVAAHDDQADAHVERAEHFVASRSRRARPAAGTAAGRSTRCGRWSRRSRRKHPRKIFGDAAAGDVRHPLDESRLEQRAHRAQVRAMRRQQRVSDADAELRHDRVRRRSRTPRRTHGGRASSRWCAGRPRADR